jgi:hypothetical protein
MKTRLTVFLATWGFILMSFGTYAQCEIKNRIYPDGSMLYFIEPVNFYWTESKSLKGGIVTDRESYFLALQPLPLPEKDQAKKMKSDLVLTLSDGKTYTCEHYDTRFLENDTVLELLYLLKDEDIDRLTQLEITDATIDMAGEEGIRKYVFKLHKAALKEQLGCFMQEEEEKMKE